MLTPNSMVFAGAAIYRTLLSPPYSRNINVISDREFSTSNDRFSTTCKLSYIKQTIKNQIEFATEKADIKILSSISVTDFSY